ncbi:hypothetical protein F5X99DRAFT_425025 [Biscogniauxia marginata]|nr:hypothetical protein F5X99DRAFT_425025 [Biscogniauxia marginata]
MKVFAVLAALASATVLALPTNSTPLESQPELHDLLMKVSSDGENSAVFDYSYNPGVDYYELLGKESSSALRPRADVNIPGLNERVTVALRIATITLIRTAANVLRVETENLVNHAITITLNWAAGSNEDEVPAGATARENVNIGNANGQISVHASRFANHQ